MSGRRRRRPASGELRDLAALARQGSGPGSPAASLAAELATAAADGDALRVLRLAGKATADPQVAAATLALLAQSLADVARQLSEAQAVTGLAGAGTEG